MGLQAKSGARLPQFQRRIKHGEAIYNSPIAEGCGRKSSAEFARFLQIAIGSTSETEYLLFLAHDLKYLGSDQYDQLEDIIISVKKMLITLLKRLET